MAKKKLDDEMLNNIIGGRTITFGNDWTHDVYCPVCKKDDMLKTGLQMYSSQSGMIIIYCERCKQGFAVDQDGKVSLVETRPA